MTIPTSGRLLLKDVLSEYGAPNTTKLSQLYRGGAFVRDNSPGNVAANLSANVPKTGALRLSSFRGQAAAWHLDVFEVVDMVVDTYFGSDYADNWKKIVKINPGGIVGNVNADWAMVFHHQWGGSIELHNHGEIQGRGGNHSKWTGGNALALVPNVPVTLYNYGAIRSGGGRGGNGGAGGGGYVDTSYTATDGPHFAAQQYAFQQYSSEVAYVFWAGEHIATVGVNSTTATVGAYTYVRGAHIDNGFGGPRYQITRTWWVSQGYNTNGGAGGTGGLGQGYNQARGEGTPGAAGGANAGAGGWGNWGGVWGTAGSTGATGAAGNRTGGSAGAAGAPPGVALGRNSTTSLTIAVSGTIQGPQQVW